MLGPLLWHETVYVVCLVSEGAPRRIVDWRGAGVEAGAAEAGEQDNTGI